jgi:regulatory protein
MSQARVAALRLLTRRDYTAKEIHQKLLDREVPEAEAAAVVADLAASGLINDRRVAESFVRVASTVKGRGRLRIERELAQRGVERSLIREVLGAMPGTDEAAAIRRFLDRKRLPARLSPPEHRRIFGQLIRRGFPPDLIARVLSGRE